MGITLTQPGEIYGMHSSPLLLIWMRPGVYWGISTRFSNQGTKWRRGTEIQEFEVKPFAERIASCELQELQHHGPYFTWTNKTTWSRIDRVFINTLWYSLFDFSQTMIFAKLNLRPYSHGSRLAYSTYTEADLLTFKLSNSKQNQHWRKHSSNLCIPLTAHYPKQKETEQREPYITITALALDLIRQQSKADWICYGDDCTRQRKVATYIHDPHDDQGHLHSGFLEVSTVLQNYYKTLLGPNSIDKSPIDPQAINMGNTLPINLQIQLCSALNIRPRHMSSSYSVKLGYLWVGELLCGLCNEEEETLEHLLLSCSWAKELRRLLSSWWPIPHLNPTYDSFFNALKRMKGTQKQKHITYAIVAAALYQIWSAQNTKVFDHKSLPASTLFYHKKA
ncbi:hypothetical protein Cgig2_013817 [Carnegiea gigantea]|uniref:Reverse transcriptase zinc-binding domain-containing protein n=1 Tax=Carnegiea gigantea TaxID=171969 RepID=A0A9Q1GU16_9CARY|nr:hypothetical protein Cgig2_013817 [Carnegiea gigantea]